MAAITQDMRYRLSLIKYAEKYGGSKAAIKYKTNRQYIYRWKRRYDGSVETLRDRSRRPHPHVVIVVVVIWHSDLGKGPWNGLRQRANIKPKNGEDSKIASLRAEKQKMERALDRLRNLYLYSEDAMSEKEYSIQQTTFTEKLDEINYEIGMMQPAEWQQSVSNEMFIAKASEFTISQKLTNRN